MWQAPSESGTRRAAPWWPPPRGLPAVGAEDGSVRRRSQPAARWHRPPAAAQTDRQAPRIPGVGPGGHAGQCGRPGTPRGAGLARSGRQTLPTLQSAGPQHGAPGPRGHPVAEAMSLRSPKVVRLVGPFHSSPPRSRRPHCRRAPRSRRRAFPEAGRFRHDRGTCWRAASRGYHTRAGERSGPGGRPAVRGVPASTNGAVALHQPVRASSEPLWSAAKRRTL